MTDIVERLRRGVDTNNTPDVTDRVMSEAADEIERLRRDDSEYEAMCERMKELESEIERLRTILQKIATLRHSNSSAASIAQSALDTMKALK